MKHQVVTTSAAPAAVGPYSQAVWAGDFLFCSGQIPLDPATGQMVSGGIEEQTQRVLENLAAILQSQGLSLANVIKTTVFLRDLGQFAAMNNVYARYFPNNPPARSTVQVARLPRDAQIEMEAIAFRP